MNIQSFSIMDHRKGNGGKREGAGRKPKAEEQRLIERITPLMPQAFKALENALKNEEQWAVKLTFEYMYGKPKQQIEQKNINYNQDLTPKEAKIINDALEKKY